MTSMTAALFDTRDDARQAVHALRDHGIDQSSISVMAIADDGSGTASDLDASDKVRAPGRAFGLSPSTPEDAARGAAEGAAIGAAFGLAAGLASIMVPGFGLIAAGGALATALGGAAAATAGGAVAGGVAGYLVDLGMPHDVAHHYSESVKRGGVLVSVHDTNSATPEEIEQIFLKHHGHSANSISGMTAVTTPDALDATNPNAAGAEKSPGANILS